MTGAINKPSVKISTAAISKSTRSTRGIVSDSRAKAIVVATKIAAAPSVSGELLPAVKRAPSAGAIKHRFELREFLHRCVATRKMILVTPSIGMIRSEKKPWSCAGDRALMALQRERRPAPRG